MAPTRTPVRARAVAWAFDRPALRALATGRLGGLAQAAADAGHRVVITDPTAAPATCAVVAAHPERLPFASYAFDRVLIGEQLPGDALAETARILRPGGLIVGAITRRDDTVPWVRRLARLVQQLDPTAMQEGAGDELAASLSASDHFGVPEQRSWRSWVPISRDGLQHLVASRPAVQRQPEAAQQHVLTEVGALYDAIARAPEPLLLPYETTLLAAVADHSNLNLNHVTESVHIRLG